MFFALFFLAIIFIALSSALFLSLEFCVLVRSLILRYYVCQGVYFVQQKQK